ncbi:hypothetical protein F5X99DRAFT_214262 [Biscogniauxia marginata]|nr:hypothetical protein F5X99DRAFT_214262 [Biscogniauxia marginata]
MTISANRTSYIMENEPNKPHDNAAAEGVAVHSQARSSSRRTTKLVLGGISIAIAITLLAIGICAFRAPIGFRILAGLATAMGAAVLIYYLLETIVAFGQQGSTRTGLGAPVALSLHLVLCLGGLVVAALLIASTVYVTAYRPAFDDDRDGTLVPVPGYVTDGFYWYNMSLAGCALTVASVLIHAVLFTLAAIDVHRGRKAKRVATAGDEEAAAPAYSPRDTSDDVQEVSSSSSSSNNGSSSNINSGVKLTVEVRPPPPPPQEKTLPREMSGNLRGVDYSSYPPEPKSRGA